MGVYTRPNIVTNGLVLNLDAANIRSYPGTGTAWTDLSGNSNTSTLTNGPTFSRDGGGSIVFNGTNQYTTFGSSTPTTFGTNDFTISSWVYFNTVVGLTDYRTILSDYTSATAVQNIIYGMNINSGAKFAIYIAGNFVYSSSNLVAGIWYNLACSRISGVVSMYINGTINGTPTVNNGNITGVSLPRIGMIPNASQTGYFNGNISSLLIYKNKGLTASEILQNYNALKSRFEILSPYESLTYLATNTITITNNGTDNVNMFKTSGANAWDSHFYSTTPFTAPCTIEFNKQAGATDNGVSYAMIGWNVDPTLDANYTSLDYASYPYATNNYRVYNNGTLVQNGGTWSTANKFYVVYDTDGFIRHYNGSTLLYSVNYGTGRTVYVDSSLYSVNATFGGFSNVRVRRNSWNGNQYV